MALFNAFRAGSGSYQQIIPLTVTVSAIPAGALSVETYSATAGNIVNGSITPLTNDSLVYVQADAQSGFTPTVGLVLQNAIISATGTLELSWQNFTGTSINPGNIQIDVLVF